MSTITMNKLKSIRSTVTFYVNTFATFIAFAAILMCIPVIGWFGVPIAICCTISYIKDKRFNSNKTVV